MLCKEIADNELARVIGYHFFIFDIRPTRRQYGHVVEASAYVKIRLIGDSSVSFSRSCVFIFCMNILLAPLRVWYCHYLICKVATIDSLLFSSVISNLLFLRVFQYCPYLYFYLFQCLKIRMALVASKSAVPRMIWLLSDFFDSLLPHWFQSHLKQCMHHLSDFSLH